MVLLCYVEIVIIRLDNGTERLYRIVFYILPAGETDVQIINNKIV